MNLSPLFVFHFLDLLQFLLFFQLFSQVVIFSFYMLQNTLQAKASEMAPQARGAGVSIYASTWSLGQAAGVAATGIAVGIVGYAPSIIAFGLGFFALGLWLRGNLHRLT